MNSHKHSFVERFFRCMIHIPVGLLCADTIIHAPLLGAVFSGGFLFYEYIEDVRIMDYAYVDLFGWLVGIAIYALILRVF